MIVHFTTVHPRTDVRIRVKEVATLSDHWPGQVALFVQDGLGDEVVAPGGVAIHDTGRPQVGRLRRMTLGSFRMFQAIRRARPCIAHFHDPELLPWAVLLRLSGMKVIYDAHEDLPAAIMSKPYINPKVRRPFAAIVRTVERALASRLSGVIAATPSIEKNFVGLNSGLVQNFPLLSELQGVVSESYEGRPPHFAYVGGVTAIRGAVEMVSAINLLSCNDAQLQVAGSASPALRARLENTSGWDRVIAHGWADRATVGRILSRCRAGLVLFHPEPNHIHAQPNKLFEYMAAGLPIIASDFQLWRNLIEEVGCGILVDPKCPQAIANAMQWMLDHPNEARLMGQRGRLAVQKQFNWEAESQKLIAFYEGLPAEI